MSRNEDVLPGELSLDQGTQLLLSLSSMQSPVAHLPADATRNLIVVSSEPPAAVADRLADAGADLDAVAHIPISGAETEYDGPMWTCDALVPDDLTGLSMRLSRAFEALGAGGYLLVENLNVFLMYAAQARVVRFLDHLTGLAEDHDITGIYTLVGDAVADETYDRLRLSVDTDVDRR
ncbi:DUF7504 family protein [Haloarcula onubensis]|uniref:DUF835 domain-containing protein n=1 Tax=Haloarcula onubensis TaxID=2950539 RepID=A0ABU2FSV3_9EURY|nr:hypothetical protein [Halomicroarcula sp. S3CR25-11]MDS0283236.1 hypothetical protein [Halomicroarcula sp. S3CR25-11]